MHGPAKRLDPHEDRVCRHRRSPEAAREPQEEKYVTQNLKISGNESSPNQNGRNQTKKGWNMSEKSSDESKNKVRLDPRYASARPWDWRVCRDCQALVPVRCPQCGSERLSGRPRDVVRAGLHQFGPPPGFFQG